jgi:predicted secreted protein
MTLHNVISMEDTPVNLLDQGTLIEKGWSVDITKEGGVISQYGINIPVYKTGPGGTLRAIRLPLRKDFFKQSEQQENAVSVKNQVKKRKGQDDLYLTVQDKDTIEGWHNRLGHMGVSTIKKLAASGQLQITDKDSSTFKMEECEVCAIAKTTRLTFGDISVAAQVPLEIVHSAIAGPLKPDINGHIYYVTNIDDLTGLTYIDGLKTKQQWIEDKTAMDVLRCFKNCKRISELTFNGKVQCLRIDNGGEYLGGMGS